MQVINVRPVIVGVMLVACCTVAATASYAQTPGAPEVSVLPDNSVIITYAAPVAPPAGTLLVATLNGGPIGPFAIGTATTVSSGGPLPAGVYSVQIAWSAGVVSPITSFVIAAGTGAIARPDATVMRPAVLSANNVTLTWDALPTATSYEIEAVMFETGRIFTMAVGNQTSLVVPNVPFGNYSVRVRGRNALGVGPYSNATLVSVGTTVRVRDLEVTLTWNSFADIDLHVIEPNGTRVSWQRRNGVTTQLDRDNTTGFGPETASVPPGGAAAGVYQVYIVHFRGPVPTTSTVAVSLNVGTANVQTMLFTRQSSAANPELGYNVALVDPRAGVIGEITGTRVLPAAAGTAPLVKP